VGHHRNYLDQTKDESRWQGQDGRPMSEGRYVFETVVTAYPRAYEVGHKHKKEQRILVTMGLLQLVLLAGLLVLRPYNALFVFVLPMIISISVTVWATYFHHGGLVTDDHMQASYNIMHRGYNLATGNLGYHTAHHARHGLHWSKLPAYHAEIASKIPSNLYREPGIPFRWTGTEAIIDQTQTGGSLAST
jgi:fatty acid desaturase